MNYEPVFSALAAAGSGFGCAILFARYIVAKTLEDLKTVSKAVGEIRESIAAITVRLSIITEHDAALKDHAKRLAFWEGEKAHASRRAQSDGSWHC